MDPPSFSRGTKGSFSTSKDLKRLHAAAFELLEPGLGGVARLVTTKGVATAKMKLTGKVPEGLEGPSRTPAPKGGSRKR